MERPLTEHIREDKRPLSLKEYEKVGGYEAIRKVMKGMTPKSVQDVVKESNLRGRGGAGFATGLKWSFVPMNAPTPHQLIEGMIISAYAIQADQSFFFLRWAYKNAAQAITKAIHEAYEAGYLGKNILGSGFDLEMHLHTGVGRYMCGEETALLNSLEGKRATPRAKPPFPQISGLFGKPTIVNNVETLCCVPHIINKGPDWFQALSRTRDAGTKIYGISGKVKKPGAWELPMGVTMRELIDEYGGGMQDGVKFKGALPGGASVDFLVEEHLDVKLDYTHVAAAGSRLGTGTLIILDDKTCPVGFVQNMEHFFAQESCGFCTPCREGLPWVAKILASLDKGEGRQEDIDLLHFHTKYLGPGNTFCALAPGAMAPLQSALKYFINDFEKHVHDQKCPWK
jgi:NADH-quinone oxidoreductase subunit F